MRLNSFFFVFVLAFASMFIISCNSKSNDAKKEELVSEDVLRGKITVAAVSEDFVLANTLANAFVSEHNSVIIDVVKISPDDVEKSLNENLYNMVLSSGKNPASSDCENFFIARDALVLCVNFDNPVLQKLAMKGISKTVIKDVYSANQLKMWSEIYKCQEVVPLKAFLASEKSSAVGIVKSFLGTEFGQSAAFSVDEPDLYNNISNQIGAIGFLSSTIAYDHKTKMRNTGLYIVPIDLNENKTADNSELIYDDVTILSNNIASGKFPKELVRNHYFLWKKDAEQIEIISSFVDWMKTNSTTYVNQTGFFAAK